mmetsp:Transcript_107162/g.298472  ORF Transcript_107162/g.298472 Transcript_107162/m.298472 type:complete len:247 (+) Transcript_107162:1087-1827(+)
MPCCSRPSSSGKRRWSGSVQTARRGADGPCNEVPLHQGSEMSWRRRHSATQAVPDIHRLLVRWAPVPWSFPAAAAASCLRESWSACPPQSPAFRRHEGLPCGRRSRGAAHWAWAAGGRRRPHSSPATAAGRSCPQVVDCVVRAPAHEQPWGLGAVHHWHWHRRCRRAKTGCWWSDRRSARLAERLMLTVGAAAPGLGGPPWRPPRPCWPCQRPWTRRRRRRAITTTAAWAQASRYKALQRSTLPQR